MIATGQVEVVDDFTSFGMLAFTSTRAFGSLSTGSSEPVRDVMGRWDAIRATLAGRGITRLATASQVHGGRVILHEPGWEGWLRGSEADGHAATRRGTGLAVTIADCVPVFLGHPSGATGVPQPNCASTWVRQSAEVVTR